MDTDILCEVHIPMVRALGSSVMVRVLDGSLIQISREMSGVSHRREGRWVANRKMSHMVQLVWREM